MKEHLEAIAFLPFLLVWGALNRAFGGEFNEDAELRAKHPDLYSRHWTDGTD